MLGYDISFDLININYKCKSNQSEKMKDYLVEILITQTIGVIGVISELGPSIDPFEKASQALNVSYRETILFALLAIPSDDVKLAVVRSLYSVRLDEFDK